MASPNYDHRCETYLGTNLALRHLLPLQGRRQIGDLLVDRTDPNDVNDAAVGRHRRWRRRCRRRSRCRGGRHGLSGARWMMSVDDVFCLHWHDMHLPRRVKNQIGFGCFACFAGK